MACRLSMLEQKLPRRLRPSRHDLKGRRRLKKMSPRKDELRASKRPPSNTSTSGSDVEYIALGNRNRPAESTRLSIPNDSRIELRANKRPLSITSSSGSDVESIALGSRNRSAESSTRLSIPTDSRIELRGSKRPLSSTSSSGSDVESIALGNRNRPAESSTRLSIPNDNRIEVPRSSVLIKSSAGMKLGHMLSLIHQDDVEFKQHPFFTELEFVSSEEKSRLMHPLSARRLRSLIAFAHHLDEVGPP